MNQPNLRFTNFEELWKSYRFNDVVKIVTGLVNPKVEPYCNMPHVGTANIESFTGKLLEYNLAKHDNLTSGKYLFNENHVVYGKINPQLAKVVFPGFKGICSADAYPLECRDELLIPSFLKYLLLQNRFFKYSVSVSKRTGMPKINRDELAIFKFVLPNLNEQQKIASFLSAVDKRIELLQRKKDLLEDYKKGVLQQLFSQQIRFKDENGNDFPDWEPKKLGDILIEVTEKTTVSNQYTILSSTAKGLYNQSDYFNRDIASKDNTGYKILRKNQLVFSPQNLWLGNINVNTKFEIGIVSPSYKIFKFNENHTSSSFCKYFLFTNRMFYEYAQASEQGASVVRRNLDMSSFNAIPIKLPSKIEQQKIASFLSAIDSKIETTNQQIEGMQTFKKGLLQQMFV